MIHPRVLGGIALFIWAASILFLCWVPEQSQFSVILPCLITAFGSYIYLSFYDSAVPLKWALLIGIVIRLLIVPTLPHLSDDIFRFIWDGRLWQLGIHPYSALPSELLGQDPLLTQDLYDNLNSQGYYSIYPPIPQLIFWIATFFPTSDFMTEAIIMKFIHALFDIANILLIRKILISLKMDVKKVLLYALNPLIIIELISNLHHEGIVIFFILFMIYMIYLNRPVLAGLMMACAIATKILPILYCPLIFFYLKGKQRWLFTTASTIVTIALFLPLLADMGIITNLTTSADLYLRRFEFNGGIYYLYRALGYMIYGYNKIHIIGPLLTVSSAVLILYLAFRVYNKRIQLEHMIMLMVATYTSYVLLSITIHPWYVAVLIPLSLFTPYRWPILWSGLIMLTYVNYSFESYHEVLWVVAIEYSLVFGLLAYEVIKYKGWDFFTSLNLNDGN